MTLRFFGTGILLIGSLFPFSRSVFRINLKTNCKEFCMKNFVKLIGIIALVAAIGFRRERRRRLYARR
jgi:preprotein translocase subunit Sss1